VVKILDAKTRADDLARFDHAPIFLDPSGIKQTIIKNYDLNVLKNINHAVLVA